MNGNHKLLERRFHAEPGSGQCRETLVSVQPLPLIGGRELCGLVPLAAENNEPFLGLQQASKIIFDEMLPIDNLLEDSFHTIEPRGAVWYVFLFHFTS